MATMRLLTLALALLLSVSFATPSHVYAESAEGFTFTVSDSHATVTGCVGSCPAALEIPAVLGGITVTAIGASAFYGAGLTSLVIPDSVTAIGFRSFAGNSLNAVTLGASLATIGDYAFFLNALTSIRIPATVTAIGSQAFRYNSLTNVTFAGNAPTAGSLVLADNSALTRVFRSVSASGWVATWGGIQVVNFEQAETWVARGATSDDDVNGETAGTSCSNPDYIAGPTAADVQIQLGINLTLPGGIVHLCPGVYSSDATLNVIHDVTLKGAGANVSILDGTLINWTILDSSGALVVSNLGFQNGRRAINCLSGSVTVSGSAFNDNAADRGTYVGGIYANGCTAVNVTSSSFANNISSYGSAAIYMQNGGSLTISSSTFIDNHGSYGGAVYTDGDATVTSSKFTNNSSDNYGDGGAIHANLVTVTNSAFTNNSARFGGAIHANDATVASSTFTGNTTYFGHGGAIYASRGSLQRSRFTRNAAGQHGGAVYFYAATADDLQLLLRNTFTRNAAAAGGAITFASCGPRYSRSQVRRVERANRFVGNRATAQRRTKNIERWAGGCG